MGTLYRLFIVDNQLTGYSILSSYKSQISSANITYVICEAYKSRIKLSTSYYMDIEVMGGNLLKKIANYRILSYDNITSETSQSDIIEIY